MAVPPDGLLAVAAVPGHLGPQAGLVHGGEVDLEEGAGHARGFIHVKVQLGVGVGAKAAGASVARPVFPGVLVPAPAVEPEPDVRADLGEGHVEAGDRRRVAKEQRVRGALARGGGGALDDPGAGTGQPPVEGRRTRRRVRTGPFDKRAVAQPREPIVDGPFGTARLTQSAVALSAPDALAAARGCHGHCHRESRPFLPSCWRLSS